MYKKILDISLPLAIIGLVVELLIGYSTPVELRPRPANLFDILIFAIPTSITLFFGSLYLLNNLKSKLLKH